MNHRRADVYRAASAGQHNRNLENGLVDGAVKSQSRVSGHVVQLVSEQRARDCDRGGFAHRIDYDEQPAPNPSYSAGLG
jgi:hypothetical protein